MNAEYFENISLTINIRIQSLIHLTKFLQNHLNSLPFAGVLDFASFLALDLSAALVTLLFFLGSSLVSFFGGIGCDDIPLI